MSWLIDLTVLDRARAARWASRLKDDANLCQAIIDSSGSSIYLSFVQIVRHGHFHSVRLPLSFVGQLNGRRYVYIGCIVSYFFVVLQYF